MMPGPQTVSSVVQLIKRSLESQFQEVLIQGEVSNLSQSSAGHWYFTLSDEGAAISCALFKMDALRNPFIRQCQDGNKVLVTGPISVYLKRGTFQLITKSIKPLGQGDLKAQFEKLKKKLAQEGLFDLDRKNKLPSYPKKIAVITAIHGAALQDFLNVFLRRSLWCDIVIIPAQVQGDRAPKTLCEALDKAQQISDVDTIVLTRGGGSMEDLWAFNDEELVRKMAKCSIPLVSAVGHQVDFTLSDFVADVRCETPTAAAEILTQNHSDLSIRMKHSREKLASLLERSHLNLSKKLVDLHPKKILDRIYSQFQYWAQKIHSFNLIDRYYELTRINEYQMLLDDFMQRGKLSLERKATSLNHRVDKAEQLINAFGPYKVLQRGYAIVQSHEGVVDTQKRFAALPSGAPVTIRFYDGEGEVLKR